jgi:hypothetical protein
MLTKCANPSCSASFRHLQDGRLFLLEADLTLRSSEVKAPEYFWLYKACSVKMTLRLAPDGIVMATGLRKALRNGPQPALFFGQSRGRAVTSQSYIPSQQPPGVR